MAACSPTSPPAAVQNRGLQCRSDLRYPHSCRNTFSTASRLQLHTLMPNQASASRNQRAHAPPWYASQPRLCLPPLSALTRVAQQHRRLSHHLPDERPQLAAPGVEGEQASFACAGGSRQGFMPVQGAQLVTVAKSCKGRRQGVCTGPGSGCSTGTCSQQCNQPSVIRRPARQAVCSAGLPALRWRLTAHSDPPSKSSAYTRQRCPSAGRLWRQWSALAQKPCTHTTGGPLAPERR